MRDDRLARKPPARPLVLHSLYRTARAFPEQRHDVQHTIRPNATHYTTSAAGPISSASAETVFISGHHHHVVVRSRGGRRRRGSFHATHELPQIA
jgi:hypothetical protein